MTAELALEATIDKILTSTEDQILSSTRSVFKGSLQKLDDSAKMLQEEYDRIISDGNREADKISRQVIGSADLDARNKQLFTVEDAVTKVISEAVQTIADAERDQDYENLIRTMLYEAVEILGTTKITVYTNDKDRDVVSSVLNADISDATLSDDVFECLGGIVAKSQDGSMTFDNTLDARIKHLKPLIRKEIASKFGVGDY